MKHFSVELKHISSDKKRTIPVKAVNPMQAQNLAFTMMGRDAGNWKHGSTKEREQVSEEFSDAAKVLIGHKWTGSGKSKSINHDSFYHPKAWGHGITVRPDGSWSHTNAAGKSVAKGVDHQSLDTHLKSMRINEEMDQLEERKALNFQQRRKRAMVLKRIKNKLKIARARASRRIAPRDRLMVRAERAARQLLRKRLAGSVGANYVNLSASQKQMVDQKLANKTALIKKIATRLFPKIQKKELERFRKMNANRNAIVHDHIKPTQEPIKHVI